MTCSPVFSIIIPVYNEALCIRQVHEELCNVLCDVNTELIYVNDGSTDNSLQVLTECYSQHPEWVTVVSLYGRNGKAMAQRSGLAYANSDYVVFMDADGQDDPEDILRLYEMIRSTQSEIVVGWRQHRASPPFYRILSLIFNWMIRLFSGLPIHDSNSSLKIIRKSILNSIPIYSGHYRFLPYLFYSRGLSVLECEVHHRPRIAGISKYGPMKTLEGLWDLVTIFFLSRNHLSPLRFFGTLGFMLGIPGIIICIYISYLRLTYGYILNRYPFLFLGVLLILAGLQLICTGLLAELFIYTQSPQQHMPLIRNVLQKSKNIINRCSDI
ncbi:MAG: glycosyltransferase family 2 protein [Desulfobacterales bacterium]|nr:glycosyltransferase family 2 protein [Desulfobacterales bacterium]